MQYTIAVCLLKVWLVSGAESWLRLKYGSPLNRLQNEYISLLDGLQTLFERHSKLQPENQGRLYCLQFSTEGRLSCLYTSIERLLNRLEDEHSELNDKRLDECNKMRIIMLGRAPVQRIEDKYKVPVQRIGYKYKPCDKRIDDKYNGPLQSIEDKYKGISEELKKWCEVHLKKFQTSIEGLSKLVPDNQGLLHLETSLEGQLHLETSLKGLLHLETSLEDIDKCATLPPSCIWNQGLCEYKEGTDFCSCENGWKVSEDNGSCVDIDECNATNRPCSKDEECVNLRGGYTCNCKNGFCKEKNIFVARCNKTCDIATSKCILIDGLESCRCNAGYSKIYTNKDDILCVPNCSQTCDAVKAQCIVEKGAALCKCKVEYGIGSGLASDGNNSCSPKCNKTCDIATSKCVLTDGLESCQCNAGYSKIYTNNDDNLCVPNCSQTCDPVKAQCIVENGAALCKCKFDYGIGSGLASEGNNSCSRSSFINLWTNFNQLMDLKIDEKARQIKPIYGELNKHKEAQGFWFSLPSKIVVVVDTLHTNVNMVLSAVGYAAKGCILIIRFDKYKKETILLKEGVFHDFKLHYGIKDIDFERLNLNIDASDCNFTLVYLFSVKISFEDINECTSLVSPCSGSNVVCKNTYGSYVCQCAEGWKIEEKSCVDINECTAATAPCPMLNGVCENTMGSYICKCESGWMLNGNICIDINECNATTSLCSWGNGICHNTNGSYFCTYLKEFQNNSSFAYALVENATQLHKENGIAFIPKLNREFLLTFDIFQSNFNGSRSVICLSLDSGSCKSSVLRIHVDPDGSLVFIKSGYDHYNKFKHPISVRKWINIEISQLSSIRKDQYNYTIKVNKINVFSVIIQNKHEYDNIRVLASDSLYDDQDCLIGMFYFINGKLYNELYLVVVLPKGLNLKNAWFPDDESYWSRFQNNNEKLMGMTAYRDYNVLGFWATKNEGLEVFIDPFWTNLPNISFNFRLSIILYALRPSNLSVNYTSQMETFYLKNIELINNSFVTSEIVMTFDQYKEFMIFEIGFYRVNNNPIYLISVNASLEDTNECNDTSRCPWTNSECENTFGSYLCKCKIGFLMSKENDSCVDINECDNKTQCPWTNALCFNTYGSFLCKCEYGWKLGEDKASCINSSHSVPASVFKVNVSILVPVLLVLIILVVVIVLWIRRSKKFQQAWLNQDPYTLENYLEYQKLAIDKWEILPSNIIFGKKIGEGAFGNVFIAKIKALTFAKMNHLNHLFDDLCNINEDSTINVAVKLIKDGASDLEYNDFVNEITLMKGIGYHKNIVNMIGCCTFRKYLCLVNEFMENGDLLHFLRNTRIKFTSSNDEIEAQVRFIYTHTNPQLFEKTKLMQNEIPLMDMEPIKSSDLLSFAWQIASGMEYLSCIKLVHRDLAARNILVGAKKNLKISDFGLTCKLNDEANYTGKTNRRLPIKWMSVEAIFYRLFTTYSDVWSYGVVLFEIVTLGGTPYSTISNRELLSLLKSGYRMERPDNCSQTVYDIMLRCWNQDPLMRPTFTELRELFEKIMSHGDRYVSLDIDKENAYYKTNSSSSSDKIDELKQEEVLLSSKTSRRI